METRIQGYWPAKNVARRRFLAGAGASSAAFYLAACSSSGNNSSSAPKSAASAPAVGPSPGAPANPAVSATRAATAAAAAASPAAAAIKDGGTLTTAISGNVINLDPHANVVSTGLATAYVRMITGNGPQFLDFDLKYKPDLADDVSVSADGLVYTLVFKSGLKFSNGKPLNSRAVVRNYERAAVTEGAKQAFTFVKGYDTPDDTTVKITLTQPSGSFLAGLSQRIFLADMDNLDIMNPIGAGPWILDNWAVNQQLVFRKNPTYFDAKRIHFDRLIVKLGVDPQAQFNGAQSGQYDIASLPNDLIPQAKSNKSVSYLQIDGLACNDHIYLKMTLPPFNDPRMRQAVDLAIDRNEIRDVVYSGLARAGASWLPPTDPYYVKDVDDWKLDLQQAKTLVQQAGADGMEIEYQHRTDPPVPNFATLVQGQLAKIGLKIKLTPIETAKYTSDVIFGKKFIMASYGSSWRPDPDFLFYIYFHSTGSANFPQISDPNIDALLDKGRVQSTFAERYDTYAQFQRLGRATRAYITTGQTVVAGVTQSNIIGYRLHPDTTYVLYQDVARKA